MKLPSFIVPTLAVLTVAKKLKETSYPVEVSLKAVEGSVVNVTIANKGGKDINLFSRATILDPNPVRKLNLTSPTGKDSTQSHVRDNLSMNSGKRVPYIGAHARVALENLNKQSFEKLKHHGQIEVSIDLADLYDIREGGTYEVSGDSSIAWAWAKSTKLEGDSRYTTNALTITVPKLPPKPKQATLLMSDCTGQRRDDTKKAEAVCAMLAVVAGTSAKYGDAEQ
jgi:deuterolysin